MYIYDNFMKKKQNMTELNKFRQDFLEIFIFFRNVISRESFKSNLF